MDSSRDIQIDECASCFPFLADFQNDGTAESEDGVRARKERHDTYFAFEFPIDSFDDTFGTRSFRFERQGHSPQRSTDFEISLAERASMFSLRSPHFSAL